MQRLFGFYRRQCSLTFPYRRGRWQPGRHPPWPLRLMIFPVNIIPAEREFLAVLAKYENTNGFSAGGRLNRC